MRRAIWIASLLLVAGCASTQAPPSARTTVPADRMGQAMPSGDAEIVVVRDVGVLWGGCFHALEVNGVLVARMDAGETVRVRVPAGELLIGVGRDPSGKALCSTGQGHKVLREFSIRSGETKHYRMTIGSGGLDVMRADNR